MTNQPITRKRKSFKSETIRLASTSVDVTDAVGKEISSTADVISTIVK